MRRSQTAVLGSTVHTEQDELGGCRDHVLGRQQASECPNLDNWLTLCPQRNSRFRDSLNYHVDFQDLRVVDLLNRQQLAILAVAELAHCYNSKNSSLSVLSLDWLHSQLTVQTAGSLIFWVSQSLLLQASLLFNGLRPNSPLLRKST